MIYGKHDQKTIEQFNRVMKNADRGALMADGHIGYVMPIGGVAAYKGVISPSGVGYDIACGNMAVMLDIKSEEIKDNLDGTLDWIQSNISFGIGRKNKKKVDHEIFDDCKLWLAYDKKVREKLHELAREQLGTVGSGNHYIDIFEDEKENIWVGVHFGSRGLGHRTATGFMNLALTGKWERGLGEREVLLDVKSDLGERYYTAMNLAGKYAYAGREWVVKQVSEHIRAKPVFEVHNHHNYAWEEVHSGKKYMVVRKGATPAFPGQKGFVGGSMGDNAVIVEGIESKESSSTLYSTVHGAGRVMGRMEAKGKYRRKKRSRKKDHHKEVQREGKVTWEMMEDWLKEKKVKLRGGGRDESPHVYRRLSDVLDEHKNTIKILHTLKPIGVVMAGENEFDPYKD